MRYVYSTVRFVPDPFRDESVNVAAIVGSDLTSEWDIVQVSNLKRARSLAERPVTVKAVADFVEGIAEQLDPYSGSMGDADWGVDAAAGGFVPSESWLTALSHGSRGVVQVGPPLPVAAESIQAAINSVVARQLVDPTSNRQPYQTRARARSTARDSFFHAGLVRGQNLFESVTIEAARAVERIDFAVVNGKALQLTQAWSFQLPRQEELEERVKAWGWSLSRLRDAGGFTHLDGRRVEIPADVEIDVVLIEPAEGDSRALETATSVFDSLSIRRSSVDATDELAERAATLLDQAS